MTFKKFQAVMRAAGWQRMPGPGCTFEHPDGGKVDLFQYLPNYGELWRYYVANECMPETTLDPIAQGYQVRT